MTAVELIGALKYAVLHVGQLRGLPFWRKVQIALLKIVAICAYNYGKVALAKREGTSDNQGRNSGAESSRTTSRKDTRSSTGATSLTRTSASLKIAVVIPVYVHSTEQFGQVFAALLQLSKQERMQDVLILVDDASPLPLPTIISNEKVVVLRQKQNQGPAAARNTGLQKARQEGADIICFMDADCLPEPDWVLKMEAAQQAEPGIVSGRTISTQPGTAVGLYHDVCGTLNGRKLKDGTMLYGCTCNLSISVAAVALEFDESFSAASFEDVEFCVRARKMAIPLTYNKHAVVFHHYEQGVFGLFRQFRRYGQFEPQMCAKHKEYQAWLWASAEISSFDVDEIQRRPPRRPRLECPPTAT